MADIYGQSPDGGLANGGVVDGSLEITEDLKVDGDAEIDGDLTIIGNIVSADELKVADSFITCGFENPADLINLGVLFEHDFGTGGRYGGVVRRAADKVVTIYNNITPKPVNLGALPPSDAILEASTFLALQSVNAPVVDTQIVNSTGVQLILTAPGQVIVQSTQLDLTGVSTVRMGAGRDIEWQGKPDQFVRDSVGTLTISGEDKLQVQSVAGDLNLGAGGRSQYTASGSLSIRSDNADIGIAAEAVGADVNLTAANRVILNAGNQVQVGATGSPDAYSLATTRGLAGEVLTTDGAGGSSWQPPTGGNPFDQSLNVADSVAFASVELAAGGSLGWAGKPSQQLLDIGGPGAGSLILNADANLILGAPGGIQVNAVVGLSMQGATASVQANTGDAIMLSLAGDVKLQAPTGQIQLANTPLIGAPATGFTLPTVRGTVGQYLRQNAAGIVSWANVPSAAYGNLNMIGNATTTTFLASQTYVVIGGAMVAGELADFTLGANLLTYTGETAQFLVSVSQTWIHGGGTPDEFRLAIFKNGVIVANTEQRANLDSDTDYPRSSSANGIIELTTNDTIEVRVANWDDTTSVQVVDFAMSVIKVGLVAGGGGAGGDVIGPAAATDSGLALYDGVSGKLLKDSPATLTASGTLSIVQPAGPQVELSDSLNVYQTGLFGGVLRTQKGPGDVIWDTSGNRFNVYREAWVQNKLEINPGLNSVSLPQTRGLSGQVITADGLGASTWAEPVAKITKVYSQIAQNSKAATAPQSIYNILGPEGLGSKTLPANSPLGTSIAFKCSGTYTYSGGTTNILLVIGGNTLPFGFAAIGAILGYQFNIDLTVSLRTLGAGGTAWAEGSFSYVANPASGQVARIPLNGTILVNTTVDNVMDLQASFTAVGNILATESGSIVISRL